MGFLKRFLLSEAGAAVLWVLSVLVLSALLVPWLYQGGKGLADAAASRELPGILEWLGAACGRADFDRFYSRSLVVAALAMLPFLCLRVRTVRAARGRTSEPRARASWQSAMTQIVLGCVIAGGMLWGLAVVLEGMGAFVRKPEVPGFGKLMGRILVPVLVVPPLEEWLFRGLLLGLWLRFAKPLAACVGTSLIFAFVHFLKPPDGSVIADPASALAGFELLGKVLLHFTNPLFFVTDFASLFIVGMILAWARVRTGELWFSIGLHAGWIAAFKAFNLFYRQVATPSWGIGDSIRSGMFPILTLVLTAVLCHFVLRRFEARPAVG